MNDTIRCSACPMMKVTGRATYTGNNDHMAKPRGQCCCKHDDAEAAFKIVCPKSPRMPGFIAFTVGATDKPDIKTAPKWCPRKLMKEPKEISKKAAYRIVDTEKPLGVFFVQEPHGYTGIDNRSGEVLVEDFPTKAECLEWLKAERRKQ